MKFNKKVEDKTKNVPKFYFLLMKAELLEKLLKIVKMYHEPSNLAVLCQKKNKEFYITQGKRATLTWEMNELFQKNKLNGDWISDELIECLKNLLSCGFKIHGIISDNHSSNVTALNFFF